MKKVLLIVTLLTLSLSFTYAQASVSGWGRGIFVPVAVADEDPISKTQATWGGAPRIGFTISGSSDNIGAQADITFDGGGVGTGDNVKIWAKPIEMLTVTIGQFFDDTLRGSGSFCSFNWVRPGGIVGDDLVFMRVGRINGTNFEVALAPADGAYIYAAFGHVMPGWWDLAWGPWEIDLWDPAARPTCGTEIMMQMLKEGQYGAGYDIPGIGVIRAQFMGKASLSDEPWGIINAAFKLTMVEGLMVDLGGFIPTDSDQNNGNIAAIALYGNYVMDTLTLHLAGILNLYDEDFTGSADPGFNVALGVEYGLEGGRIQADVRYSNDVYSSLDDGQIDIGLFYKFEYSNGLFGIGAQMTTGNFTTGVTKTDPSTMAFIIPIRLEYWF
jgi:hypothetical protein